MFRFRKQPSATPRGPVEYLVVGLGNPGKKYENTRHNAGFAALDVLAERHGDADEAAEIQSSVRRCVPGGRRVLLLKPQTF